MPTAKHSMIDDRPFLVYTSTADGRVDASDLPAAKDDSKGDEPKADEKQKEEKQPAEEPAEEPAEDEAE